MRTYDEIINDYYSWYGAGKVTPEELDYASEVELSIYAPTVRKEMKRYTRRKMLEFVHELYQNDLIMFATHTALNKIIDPNDEIRFFYINGWRGGNPLMIY